MGTDTAYRGNYKSAFHNAINTEFSTNACVTRKDIADCGCSRFVFHGTINSWKPATLLCHGTDIGCTDHEAKKFETRMSWQPILRAQITDKNAGTRFGTADRAVGVIPIEHGAMSNENRQWAMFQNFYVTN
ncbi:unnamed protein product, partial [Ixodes persulcatus]